MDRLARYCHLLWAAVGHLGEDLNASSHGHIFHYPTSSGGRAHPTGGISLGWGPSQHQAMVIRPRRYPKPNWTNQSPVIFCFKVKSMKRYSFILPGHGSPWWWNTWNCLWPRSRGVGEVCWVWEEIIRTQIGKTCQDGEAGDWGQFLCLFQLLMALKVLGVLFNDLGERPLICICLVFSHDLIEVMHLGCAFLLGTLALLWSSVWKPCTYNFQMKPIITTTINTPAITIPTFHDCQPCARYCMNYFTVTDSLALMKIWYDRYYYYPHVPSEKLRAREPK